MTTMKTDSPLAVKNPHESVIDGELLQKWRHTLTEANQSAENPDNSDDANRLRTQAGDLYFQEILPSVLSHLENQDRHRRLRDKGVQSLVSTLGFSPETTVIATCLLRPRRLGIIYSPRTSASYNRVFNFLVSNKILEPCQITPIETNPVNHNDIYHRAYEFLVENPVGPHVVDVTGGKKIMSATGAQVAWELDIPLCYVENELYDPVIRRPIPGHEELILLPNPSQLVARQERANALTIYSRRNYAAARESFVASRQKNANRVLEDFALALCPCYEAWTNLNLTKLREALPVARASFEERPTQELFQKQLCNIDEVHRHFDALETVAAGDGLGLLSTFLELSMLYHGLQRFDFACLWLYRAMEKFVEFGLCSAAGGEFSMSEPNYDRLNVGDSHQKKYADICKDLWREEPDDLPRKNITFLKGLTILCVVKELNEQVEWSRSPSSFVKQMMTSARIRNNSVLAHGTTTLTEENSRDMYANALFLADVILTDELRDVLQSRRNALKPIRLQDL